MDGIYMNNHEALNYEWGATMSAINNTPGKPVVTLGLALGGAELYNLYDHFNTGRSPIANQQNHKESIVRGYLNNSSGVSISYPRNNLVRDLLKPINPNHQ